MPPLPAMRAGGLALVCALAPIAHAATSGDLLTGEPRLACEAILCLSSSVRPSECSPSLDHYFDIKVFKKHGLDWSATVAARRAFLGLCPAGSEAGMPARLDAISQGAGKCDAEYLNRAYRGISYKYRYRPGHWGAGARRLEVHEIPTVTLNTLPPYCVAYNDHEWTYDLSVKYVGTPEKGGHWVKAKDYEAAQAAWNADHGGNWASGWKFSLTDPRPSSHGNNRGGNER